MIVTVIRSCKRRRCTAADARQRAEVGLIDPLQDAEESGNQHVKRRTVTVDQRGIVVSRNLAK